MNPETAALIFWLLLVAATGVGILLMAKLFGRRGGAAERAVPYECGLDPASPPRGRPAVAYFLIAAIFLIFDAEILLLVPWAAAFRETARAGAGLLLMIEIGLFLSLIALALLYAWGRRALEWETHANHESRTTNRET